MRLRTLTFASAVALAASHLPEAVSAVFVSRAVDFGKSRVTDDTGKTRFIVDLTNNAHENFSGVIDPSAVGRFHGRHSAKVQNLIVALERAHGFKAVYVTSWVGNSFSAYLTESQVSQLQVDPRVVRISEVVVENFSAPWSDSTIATSQPPYFETHSWGRNAVNGGVASNTRRVYIIDGGAGHHEDLPSGAIRVSAVSGVSAVGCYPHATHVAGILAATYGNKGVAGVNAGAQFISVSALDGNQNPAICGNPARLMSDSIGNAIDWAKWDMVTNAYYKAGIVNISLNGTSFAAGQTNREKVRILATPYVGGYVYAGAFVAQSAGNGFQSACQVSYASASGTASVDDGVMVVGAINSAGNPVTNTNGGFVNMPIAANEAGSNHGNCVDIWAPGRDILSTYGPDAGYDADDQSTWQSQSQTYANYVRLSGTSMAAPHIAGVAARLAEAQNLTFPSEIEAAVRSASYATGLNDASGVPVRLVVLP